MIIKGHTLQFLSSSTYFVPCVAYNWTRLWKIWLSAIVSGFYSLTNKRLCCWPSHFLIICFITLPMWLLHKNYVKGETKGRSLHFGLCSWTIIIANEPLPTCPRINSIASINCPLYGPIIIITFKRSGRASRDNLAYLVYGYIHHVFLAVSVSVFPSV